MMRLLPVMWRRRAGAPALMWQRRLLQHASAFGVPGLHSPEDLALMTKETGERCLAICGAIKAGRFSPPAATEPRGLLRACDALSNELCLTADLCGVVHDVHADAEWRNMAAQCLQYFGALVAQLNLDAQLQARMRAVVEAAEDGTTTSLSDEEHIFITSMLKEQEEFGVNLPEAQREAVRALDERQQQLVMQFQNNMTELEGGTVRLMKLPAEAVTTLATLHRLYPQLVHKVQGDTAVCSGSRTALSTILASLPDATSCRAVFQQVSALPESNGPVLQALLETRHSLARVRGHPHASASLMKLNMIRSPAEALDIVKTFARELRDADAPIWRKFQEMNNGDAPLSAADLPRLHAELLRKTETVHISFGIESAFRGLAQLCDQLFGIEMRAEEFLPGECWVGPGTTGAAGGPGPPHCVRKFSFWSEDGEYIGIMYFDLAPREGKAGQWSHSVLRASSKLHVHELEQGFNAPASEWIDRYVVVDRKEDGCWQVPAMLIMASMASAIASKGLSRMSFSELQTLFHEFGHGLHCMLSRTQFQHLSGTRTATDFVEVPSHCFEMFAEQYEFVRQFAAEELASVSEEEFARCVARGYLAETLALQRLSANAIFDLMVHGEEWEGACGRSAREVMPGIVQEHTSLPADDLGHPENSMSHIGTYASSQYSYVIARIAAAHIWHSLLGDSRVDRAAGKRIWDDMLRFGGAHDPWKLLVDLCGGEAPDPAHYMAHLRKVRSAFPM